MGIAAGGNINPQGVTMFEPIGGSAPKYTGKNIINPLAANCAAYMMLKTLGEDNAAARIEKGIVTALQNDIKSLSAGSMGLSTTQVGDKVASYALT
jgi:3-isopropylmalate dehydrogenase